MQTIKQRCLSWLLTLAVLTGLSPTAWAEEDPASGTVSFVAGDADGTAPAAVVVEVGGTCVAPVNTSLYVEGKTLSGWSDGETTYPIGGTITVTGDVELSPVFTDNTVALGDAETTVVFDFSKGAVGALALQGNTGFVVAQAVVGEATIDIKCDIDATKGKLDNSSRNDKWAQCNDGTVLTIPAMKGMTVKADAYNVGKLTYNGVEVESSALYAQSAEATSLSIMATGISYLATLTVTYPDASAPVIEYVDVSFAAGETTFEGSLPAGATALVAGDTTFTFPVNASMYLEGYTLKGWTNDVDTFAIGETIAVDSAMTFTPVFKENTLAIGDSAMTVVFDFQKKNIGVIKFEGNTGFVVAQAIGGGDTIDVKCDVDATGGKLANGSWDDWAQCNDGTVLTIPAMKDMTVKVVANNFSSPAGSFVYGTDAVSVDSVYTLAEEKALLVMTAAKKVGYVRTITVNYPEGEVVKIKKVDVQLVAGAEAFEGVLPQGDTALVAGSSTFTFPKNFTMYAEGKTLKGWTDGDTIYAPGATITVMDSMVCTPVFADNNVSLSDRTADVSVKFDFMRQDGAPTVAFQNVTGIWVAQAVVGTDTIDVKADFDTNNGGKFANGNWTDWAQLNGGTKFVLPSCKGAVVSMEAYSNITTTTIDGQTDYATGKVVSYEVASKSDSVEVVIGDGSYYRYITVALPYVEPSSNVFDNVASTIHWTVGNEAKPTVEGASDAYSLTSYSAGSEMTVSTAAFPDLNSGTLVKYQPANSNAGTVEGVMVEYRVKMAAGVEFKPSQVVYDAVKVGTDGATYAWSVVFGDNETSPKTLDAKAEVLRNNGSNSKASGNGTAELTHTIDVDTAGFCSAFAFRVYISGCANNKQICIGNVYINGIVNGEKEEVATYTLTASANDEAAGAVIVYPKSDEYEAGSAVTLTAIENFGYDFVNWTDSVGTEVSTEAKFVVSVDSNSVYTANFVAVETYELALAVDGGANLYMVQPTPAGTMVDGKRMYEAGTEVSLAASSNDILTFSNWDNGQTGSEIKVKMDGDVSLTAVYSAVDFIAAWDFYMPGNDGRVADFYAEDNDAAALVLRNADGATSGWLDKNQSVQGGYEGRAAAVNWRTTGLGDYYWQTKVNAAAFTNIQVKSSMLYNYNAYSKQDVEYSLDGETWSKVGTFEIEGVKQWVDKTFDLPAEANNKDTVYIRWIADKTSAVIGTESSNDGITLGAVYILGTAALVDDGTAPVLVSTVPADKATGASASGKVVLTFDEKVVVAEGAKATIGEAEVELVASGKTVLAAYKGLAYDTEYSFTLPAGSVADRTGNAIAEPISLTFTTMAKAAVTKGFYDAVVSTTEELVAAITAAEKRADKTQRFRIFVKKGTYVLPLSSTTRELNGFTVPDAITYVNSGNISFIGEDRDATVITNAIPADATFESKYGLTSKYDGIGNSDVFQLSGSDYYFQDITVKSGMNDATGRGLAIQDKATRSVYKNTLLHGYQDTWTSNNDNGLYYFEGGALRGRTDYMCGKGDAFFNGVELRQIKGGYAAVPSKSIKYGFVYKDCVINGEAGIVTAATGAAVTADECSGNYTLGRPWGSGTPVALFIDTKMNAVPSSIGWSEMSGGWPSRFAEYNSVTSTGTVVDLSGRKTVFAETHTNNPVLTADEAAEAGDLHNMFGEWDPTLLTEQAPLPANVNLNKESAVLSWTGSDYAYLYAIVRDGNVVDFTTDTTYAVSDTAAVYAVRAANEMGGLSEAVLAGNSGESTDVNPENPEGPEDTEAINVIAADGKEVKSIEVYSLGGQKLAKPTRGLNVIRIVYTDGTIGSSRMLVK